MDNIITPDSNFDFSQISLENPAPLQGGSFFTKLNFGNKSLPLYLQLPKCFSKNGMIKNSGTKKSYIDLQFNYFETDLLTWMENLEIRCRELIFSKKDLWFQSEMQEEDIENMFINPIKPYKSGKFLIIRSHIPMSKHIKQEGCLIYDENERTLDSSAINETTEFIPLVHIEGIKFSSKSFQIEINVRQIMIMSLEDNIKNNCLIKSKNPVPDNLEKEGEKTLETLENKDLENKEYIETPSVNNDDQNIDSNNLEKIEKIETIEKKEKKEEIEEETPDITNTNISDSLEISDINQLNNSKDNLSEINLDIESIDDSDNISLKKPNEVYYEIYKAAYDKAKQIKRAAIEAHLEAQKIKIKYNLDDIVHSNDEFDDFSELED
jgi:hypothetical protein